MIDQEMLQAMRTLLREEVRGVVADELQEVKSAQVAMQTELQEVKSVQVAMQTELQEFKSVQVAMQTELQEVKSALEGISDIIFEIPEMVGKHFDRLEQKIDTLESNLTDTINEMKIVTMENSYDIQVMKQKAMRKQA